MAKIGPKDTKPELIVRRLIHSMGYRYRLHRRSLPGTPDLAFPRLRKIIFVHGCFWHRHNGCKKASMPKTRAEFWAKKFAQNLERDGRKENALRALGWDVRIIWECETRDIEKLKQNLGSWLSQAQVTPRELQKLISSDK